MKKITKMLFLFSADMSVCRMKSREKNALVYFNMSVFLEFVIFFVIIYTVYLISCRISVNVTFYVLILRDGLQLPI